MRRLYSSASPRERRAARREPPHGAYRYTRRRWRVLFGVIDFLGGAFAAACRCLAPRPKVLSSDPKTILLVQLDHLGDAVMTTAILAPLRARFPHARIDVLAAPWNREVFELRSEIDRILVCDRNRFRRRGRAAWMIAIGSWGWRLRRESYDLGIDLRGEFPIALLLWLSGASRRVGWKSGGGGFLLTDSVEYDYARHEVDSRFAILDRLGIDSHAEARLPKLECDEITRCMALERAGIAAGQSLVILHVGAGTPAKRWPVEHWRQLVSRLIESTNSLVAVVASAEEACLADDVCAGFAPARAKNLAGRLSLAELVGLLSASDLMIGGDSGPAHVAAAAGAVVTTIFSGTNDASRWRPMGRNVEVVRADVACSPCHRALCAWRDHACMRRVTPHAVMAAARRSRPELFIVDSDESASEATNGGAGVELLTLDHER